MKQFTTCELVAKMRDNEASTITSLQTQLAERDKLLEQREATILEKKARIAELESKNATFVDMVLEGDDSTLEAALKSERIKTLEDAAFHMRHFDKAVTDELYILADDLKEQPCLTKSGKNKS